MSYKRSIRFTSSYVIWAIAVPPCPNSRPRELLPARNGQLPPVRCVHTREGDALFLKLNLDAAPQFPCDLILPRRCGSHLQSYRRRIAVTVLHATNPPYVHH